MGQHEHRTVVRRVIPPPAVPLLIAPRPADGTEHVAAHNGGADTDLALCHEVVVEAMVTTLLPGRVTGGAGGEHPLM
jgi:hypothetical protein